MISEAVRAAFEPPLPKDQMIEVMRVAKMTDWIPVTEATYEDHGFLHRLLNESMWNARLRLRGFMGLVKCARCHRPARCVYRVGDGLYGESCARLVS